MKYLVIEKTDTTFHYIVEDLQSLMSNIYECELDSSESFKQVSDKFYQTHTVFQIDGDINLMSL